jgi:hypothetical protein
VSDTTASGVAIDQVIVGHQFSLADFNAIGTSEEMFATEQVSVTVSSSLMSLFVSCFHQGSK